MTYTFYVSSSKDSSSPPRELSFYADSFRSAKKMLTSFLFGCDSYIFPYYDVVARNGSMHRRFMKNKEASL